MIGFGVLGASSFVANAAVIPAIEASAAANLIALGSRQGPLSYDDVLAHPDVDVVYLPLPNGMHLEWTAAAAAAGKHVLCEKPLAATAATAREMADVCRAAGVRLFEAWMTPFSPPWADAIATARAGECHRIDTRFTFTIGPGNEDNYRWDPQQGGGALLDVGIYALGPAVALWGAEPDTIEATSEWTDRGVDRTTRIDLTWAGGRRCSSLVSFAMDEAQELRLSGPSFSAELTGDAHTGVDGTYRRMIDAVCADLSGHSSFSRTVDDSIAMLALLDRIRAEAER